MDMIDDDDDNLFDFVGQFKGEFIIYNLFIFITKFILKFEY